MEISPAKLTYSSECSPEEDQLQRYDQKARKLLALWEYQQIRNDGTEPYDKALAAYRIDVARGLLFDEPQYNSLGENPDAFGQLALDRFFELVDEQISRETEESQN